RPDPLSPRSQRHGEVQLATLLWHERLRAVGIDVPWRRYVLWGLLAAPVVVALAVIPLAWR
ncbi:MAG: hypothetical protein LBE44_11580, partial [Microbacterium hominis]|nr:hypothetical protein [Microbacterium hominis]